MGSDGIGSSIGRNHDRLRASLAELLDGPADYPDVQQVPRRLIYASNEQSVNAVARTEAIARQGPDLTSTRVWWNK